jgi:hypothetical protein
VSILAAAGGAEAAASGASVVLSTIFNSAIERSSERRDANLFEVLICQIRQDDKTNVILGKTPSVLAETEPLKPVCNLLHRGCTPEIFTGMVRSRTGAAKQ